MSHSDIELRVQGPNAPEIADELARLIEADFGHSPKRTTEDREGETGQFRGEWLAVVQVLLAIPPAVLAAADLADRLQLKQKVDRLLDWAKEKLRGDSENRITVLSARGTSRPLAEMQTSELIALAMEEADRSGSPGSEDRDTGPQPG